LAVGLQIRVLAVGENFEHEQWGENIVLADEFERLLKVELTVLHSFQVPEVSQCLNPKVPIHASAIVLYHVRLHEHYRCVLVLAYFQDTFWLILRDVKVKKLLA
jgi:hypothetical protein